MKKTRSGKTPTSFNLRPELIHRLRVTCAGLGVKLSPFVEAALLDRLDAAEAGLDSPPAPAANVLPFPDLIANLDPDDAWLVHQLALILRDRPQGPIFQALQTTLRQAANTYIAEGAPPHSGSSRVPKSGVEIDPRRKLKYLRSATEADIPWLEILLKVLHSRKPGLPTAVQNNLHEFAWADEAWTELEKQNSPLVSAAPPGTGRRRGPPAELTALTRTGGDPGDNRTGATRSGAQLGALEKADEQREEQPQRAPRKTR